MSNQSHGNSRSHRLASVYEKGARVFLYLAIGLIPITSLAWTVDPLEINKQTVLIVLTALAVIAWLGSMVVRKEASFIRSKALLAALLFLGSVLVSSFVSIAPYTSWIGQLSQEYTSFLTLLCFVLFFFAGVHLLRDTSAQRVVWTVALSASALVGLIALLDLAGLDLFATNLIGVPNSLGLYLAVLAILACGLWLVSKETETSVVLPRGAWGIWARACMFVTVLSALVVLLALDYWLLWVVLLVGIGTQFAFALLRAQEFPHVGRFVLPMILFVVSIVFLFFPTPFTGYPPELSPSYGASWEIAKDTLEGESFLFGSGPGTYVMDYTQYRPLEINETQLWDERFDRSGSHLLTMLSTLGVLGLVLYLVAMAFMKMPAVKMLFRERAHDEWKMTLLALSGWGALAFAQVFYSSNFTLSFLFWMFSAVLVGQAAGRAKTYAFSKAPRVALVTAFLFVILNVGLLTMLFVSLSRYAGELAFAKAVAVSETEETLDDAIEHLSRATQLNRLSDVYQRNLGHALLLKTGELLSDETVAPSDVEAYMSASVSSALRAVELSPQDVLNWSLLGDVYREIAPLVTGADEFAIASYQEAIMLAPTNPKYHVMLARAYVVRADQLDILAQSEEETQASEAEAEQGVMLESAVETLLASIELKPDYSAAYYYLALVYERQGNVSEAIARMETLRDANPYDVGVSFQLGLLYLQQGKINEARTELERTVALAPNYSNARWYLSAVYEQQGDLEAAIEQVEEVLVYEPDNALVLQRLERLQAGLVEEEIPEPLEEEVAPEADIEE